MTQIIKLLKNKILVIAFLFVFCFIAIFVIITILSDTENNNNKQDFWKLTFDDTDLVFTNRSDDIRIHISVLYVCGNAPGEKRDVYPYEYTCINEYFSFTTEGLSGQTKIKGFISGDGFFLDISSETFNNDSISVFLEINQPLGDYLRINSTEDQIFFSEGILHANGRISKTNDSAGFIISGKNSFQIQSVPYKSNKIKSFYRLENKNPDLIAIGNLHVSFPNTLFSKIEWLKYTLFDNVSDVNYIEDKLGNVLINPDYFRFYFQSSQSDFIANSTCFLRDVLKDIHHKPELLLPLTANMAENIYNESKDLVFLNEIYNNLVAMNRRWDSILALEQKCHHQRMQLKNRDDYQIFGLPALFYYSLYQKDCRSLTAISDLLNKKADGNHFRNKSLIYSMYMNDMNLDSIKGNRDFYLFMLMNADNYTNIEPESMEKLYYEKFVYTPEPERLLFSDTIKEHYKLISFLLSYHFLSNAPDNNYNQLMYLPTGFKIE